MEVLNYEPGLEQDPPRYWLPFVLVPSCWVAAAAIGASTNAVNGLVSPEYFRAIMGWRGIGALSVVQMAVEQGIFESSCFGTLFAIVFTISVMLSTRGRCPASLALKVLAIVVVGAVVLWFIGGLCGTTLAATSPAFFQRTFIGVPGDTPGRLRYAWVGGSIWGAYAGGILSCILAPIFVHRYWKRTRRRLTLQ